MFGKDSALLIVDVLTDFDFEDGDTLFQRAPAAFKNLAKLRKRCFDAGMPVIYVNDPAKNRSMTTEDLMTQINKSDRGQWALEQLGPDRDEPIILKPQRSGFFETPLEDLLHRLDVNHVYVAGLTTDICVLFTAHDAYMRKFKVSVPGDCSTAVRFEYHEDALKFIARVAEADTTNIQPTI